MRPHSGPGLVFWRRPPLPKELHDAHRLPPDLHYRQHGALSDMHDD